MKPSRHFLCSAAFSAALAPWLKWRALLVFAGGVLLDLDRYLWYAVSHRTLRLGPAISDFQGRERIRGDLRFLHSVEFLVILIAVSVFYSWLRFIALGVVLHVLLDLLVHKSRGRFWVYFDSSHVHCLTARLVRRAGGKAARGEADAGRSERGA